MDYLATEWAPAAVCYTPETTRRSISSIAPIILGCTKTHSSTRTIFARKIPVSRGVIPTSTSILR